MKIKTNAESLAIAFVAVVPITAADFSVKSQRDESGKEVQKVNDAGKPLYRAPLTAVELDEKGVPTRQLRDISLAVVKPIDVQIGVIYRLAGSVDLTHYVNNNNRLGLSIAADTLIAGAPVVK